MTIIFMNFKISSDDTFILGPILLYWSAYEHLCDLIKNVFTIFHLTIYIYI